MDTTMDLPSIDLSKIFVSKVVIRLEQAVEVKAFLENLSLTNFMIN